MKNVLTLFKIGFLSAWRNSTGSSRRKRRAQSAAKATSVLLYGVLMLAIFGFYAYVLSELFVLGGDPMALCLLGAGLGGLLSLIFGLAKTSSVLFASRDFELLMALPLSTRQVFFSKLLIVYTFSFTGFACAALPFNAVYALQFGAGPAFYLATVLELIFLPMLLATVSGLVALLISWLARHFRSTNGAMMVFSVLAFAGYLALVFSFSFTAGNSDAGMLNMLTGLSSALDSFFLTHWYRLALLGDLASLVWLLLVCALPFALFSMFCAAIYRRVNAALREKKMRRNFSGEGIRRAKVKGSFAALFSRELKAFFSRYMYVLNCLSGLVVLLLFAGFLAFGGPGVIQSMAESNVPITASQINSLGLPIFGAVALWCIGLSPTTAAAVSMEGRQAWIVKTLPVSTRSIFRSKLYVQLLVSLPVVALSYAAYVLVLSPALADAVVLALFLLAADYFFALLGLVFNLRFPNMDWVNPNDVLKRSAPVVLTMVVDFALVIAAGVLYYFLGLPFAYFAGALAILLALASLGLWAWCQKGGARRFMEL